MRLQVRRRLTDRRQRDIRGGPTFQGAWLGEREGRMSKLEIGLGRLKEPRKVGAWEGPDAKEKKGTKKYVKARD